VSTPLRLHVLVALHWREFAVLRSWMLAALRSRTFVALRPRVLVPPRAVRRSMR